MRASTSSRTLLNMPAMGSQVDLLMAAALSFAALMQGMHGVGALGVELTAVGAATSARSDLGGVPADVPASRLAALLQSLLKCGPGDSVSPESGIESLKGCKADSLSSRPDAARRVGMPADVPPARQAAPGGQRAG